MKVKKSEIAAVSKRPLTPVAHGDLSPSCNVFEFKSTAKVPKPNFAAECYVELVKFRLSRQTNAPRRQSLTARLTGMSRNLAAMALQDQACRDTNAV